MNPNSCQKLASHIKSGQVYRREKLSKFSTAIDRDLITLVKKGLLEKVGPGLYYCPKKSRFGSLPPNDEELVKSFLKEKHFLIYSWSQYNTLGLGLTQLYNRPIVYNRKRHGIFSLGGKEFDFRRPARGFAEKLTPEFLLVDLVNNLSELTEDTGQIKARIKCRFTKFNEKKLIKYTTEYGKISTQHFFKDLKH